MFKKNRKIYSGIVLVLIFSILLGINAIAAEKPIVLKLADTTAPVGLRGNGTLFFIEEIEKHTSGKVKIEPYWGSSLLKGKEILKGIQDRVVDMGFVLPEYYSKEMPIHSIFNLFPQGPIDFNIAYELYFKLFEEVPEFTAELESFNQKLVYLNMQLPMAVICTKPFTSFEDFKGKKIRASSRWVLGMLKGTGAVPVSVPWGDLYMALSTGSIDGVATNLDGEHRTKLDEPAPNVFTMREVWMATPLMYTINLDVWNSLSKDIQDGLMAAGKAASKRFAELYTNEFERVTSEQKEQGCIVTPASKEDIEKWVNMNIIAEQQEQWVKEAEEIGIKDAAQIMERAKELIDEAIEKEKTKS